MTYEDWIFALHVVTAALLVGSVVMSWIVVVSLLSADTAGATLGLHRLAQVASLGIGAGLAGTIVLGIWTAVLRDDFEVWDGWVIAAIVLWAIAGAAIGRAGAEQARSAERAKELVAAGQTGANVELTALNRSSRALLLRAAASVVVVLIVIDMLWKPGA